MHSGFPEELESGCPLRDAIPKDKYADLIANKDLQAVSSGDFSGVAESLKTMISNLMPHETEKPVSKPLEASGNKGFEVVGGNSSPKIDCGEFEKAMRFPGCQVDVFGTCIVKWDDVWPFLDAIRIAHNTDMQALRDQLKQSTELIEMQSAKLKAMQTQTNDLVRRLQQAQTMFAQRDGLVLPGRAI